MTELNDKSIGPRAADLLVALSDPLEAEKPHVVMVTDPELAPNYRDVYGPYPNAMEALGAAERVKAMHPLYQHMMVSVQRLMTEAEMRE